MSLLESSLNRTPAERIRVHGRALAAAVALREATERRNLMRLQAALADLHPVHRIATRRPPPRLTPETAAEFRNLDLETDWGRLDCPKEILGVGDYDRVLARSIEIQLAGGPCRILTIDALVQAKQAMGRDKDREPLSSSVRSRSGPAVGDLVGSGVRPVNQ
jgi:hypothetical protein